METELEIIDSLNALDYQGKCLQNDELTRALEGGTRSVEFREVVAWLAQELHVLRKTDESVSKECDDPSEFAMELSAMLKELGCPYSRFVTGPLSERFETKEDRLQLIDFLITELMATKMVLRLKPAEQTYVIPKSETNTAKALESLTKDLCLGKPPENISPKALFDKLNFKVEERMRAVKPGVLSEPLLKINKSLTDAQWQKLQEIYEDLDKEYNLRRQVLLTRLEVTVQSFQWSDKMKTRENEIVERFQKKLKDMEYLKCGSSEDTNIVALLAARADLAVIEKTSSANVRKNTATKLQKHIIGSVPDRGGRAHEHAPPPPEMPSWQQQRSSGPAGGGAGGGRGGGGNFRGGRGGGGGGGGGNWQQNSQPQRQQHQQHYQSQQHHQQQNYEQPQRDQNWIQGSGRVQGSGWVQGGGGGGNYQGGGNYHGGAGGGNHYQNNDRDNRGGGGNYQGGGGNYQGGGGGNHYQNNDRDNRGGGGSYRGRSNYNRGGGGGGHRR